MKEISGGDKIQTRKLFGDPIYFKPQFKLLLTCNRLPYIPSTDGGTWRRLRVTPWESEFIDHDAKIENPKKQFYKDFDIYTKMEEYKAAMIWYLIKKYYGKYRQSGIREPPKVKQYTDKYKKDSDIYHEFITDTLNVTKGKRDYLPLTDLFKAFKEWYRESYTSNSCPPKKELKDYFVNHDYECRTGNVFGIKYKDLQTNDYDDQVMDI
jgi:phage/plasmid-associated DNA primase